MFTVLTVDALSAIADILVHHSKQELTWLSAQVAGGDNSGSQLRKESRGSPVLAATSEHGR